jgi:hypothetical protein
MFEIIGLLVAGGAAVGGYLKSKQFVRDRLRFVDRVYKRSSPWIAGIGAALVAAPLVAILPIVGGGTAMLFGLGVGLGVRSGVNDLKRLPGA